MIPKRPQRQWRSNSALYQGVGARGHEDAPICPTPGPRCQGVSYSPSSVSATVGVPIAPMVPAIVGATPRYWYVKPQLPAGLAISDANGTISGTPTQAKPLTVYTVHAVHSDDEALASISVTVT